MAREPLLAYLRRMVFWADVSPDAADFGVLSLLGPALATEACSTLSGSTLCQRSHGGASPDGGSSPAHADRRTTGRRSRSTSSRRPRIPDLGANGWKLRGSGRPACGHTRPTGSPALRPRLGVDTDERTIPHEVGWIGTAVHLDKGCYRGQETVARVHNLGSPPRMLVLTHLDGSVSRPATGSPLLAGGRAVGRLGTVVDHVDLGPVALALVKRGLAAETPLTASSEEDQVAVVIDPDTHARRRRRRRWPGRRRPVARCHPVTGVSPAGR